MSRTLVYRSLQTHIGGVAYGNYPHAIAVDFKGRAFITGSVYPGSIPTTSNAFQPSYGHYSGCNCASSAFVMVFDTTALGTASLVYSTYFGVTTTTSNYYGSSGNGIAVDSFGDIYITGWAGPNLPISAGAFQGTTGGGSCNPAGGLQVPCPDAFVAKLDPSASGPQGFSTRPIWAGRTLTVEMRLQWMLRGMPT